MINKYIMPFYIKLTYMQMPLLIICDANIQKRFCCQEYIYHAHYYDLSSNTTKHNSQSDTFSFSWRIGNQGIYIGHYHGFEKMNSDLMTTLENRSFLQNVPEYYVGNVSIQNDKWKKLGFEILIVFDCNKKVKVNKFIN